MRAPSFFLISGQCRCWKCGHETEVFALGSAPPFTHSGATGLWLDAETIAILSYVERLSSAAAVHLPQLAPRFFCDHSQWRQRPYWLNHCSHCGAKIGDFETIESSCAPMNPHRHPAGVSGLSLFTEPLEAAAHVNFCRDKSWDDIFARLGPQDDSAFEHTPRFEG